MRKGAFWEDRHHATAVESGNHLLQCLVYIDLNMVRAWVVKQASYSDDFAREKEALRAENVYFLNIYPNISMQ